MVSVTNAIAEAQCDLVVDAIDVGGAGKLVFYKTGSADPATVNESLQGDNTVLAELTFQSVAFTDAAVSGGSTNAVASLTGGTALTDTAANASGVAGFARAISGGGAVVAQFSVTGSVGGGSADIVVTSSTSAATFTENLPVEIASFTYSQPTV